MSSENQAKEFRLKGSSKILSYIARFSATERVVFGVLAVAAIVTAIAMALWANSFFMTEVPADGGTLREGLVGLPHNVNPVIAVTDVDKDIVSLVYAGLTSVKNGRVQPDLAQSWQMSDDGLSYTFELKPDLTFHNGSPLTSEDVVFTINKIKDPALKSPRAAEWSGVSVEATSPTTVKFSLKQPSAAFLHDTSVGILPKSIWGNVSDDQFIFSSYNVRPIGAGPYLVNSIESDQGGIPVRYFLSAWNGYAGGKPHVSEIAFTFFPDLDKALTSLSNGGIDSLSSIPPAAAARLASNSGEPYRVAAAPLTRIFGLFFNQNKNTAFADQAVRTAISLAIDRSAIINEILSGYGVTANSPFPAGVGAGEIVNRISKADPVSDIEVALTVLDKAGWKLSDGGVLEKKPAKKGQASTTISFNLFTANSNDLAQAAEVIKTQLSKIGISVNVTTMSPAELYQNVIRTRSYDALLFGEAVSKPSDLYAFWHSSQRNAPGLNVALYANSAADRLLERMRTATSSADRTAAYDSFAEEVSEDSPAAFIYSPELIYAVPKSLRGLDMETVSSPSDRFKNVRSWYMETERVWNVFKR